MLRIHVSAQVDFALKGAQTEAAGEGFEACMLSGVSDEVRRLTERLSTQGTLIGFLPWNNKQID